MKRILNIILIAMLMIPQAAFAASVPVAVYSFDGSNENCEFVNSEIYTKDCIGSGAAAFDPTKSEYITLDDSIYDSLSGANGITVSMWVQQKQVNYNMASALFSIYTGSKYGLNVVTSKLGFGIQARSTSTDGSNWTYTTKDLTGDTAFSNYNGNAGMWYHLAAVADYSGKKLKLYVNGEELISATAKFSRTTFNPGSPSPITIGSDANSDAHFGGLIDEVQIYNSALTASEIEEIRAQNDGKLSARLADEAVISKLKSRLSNGMTLFAGENTVLNYGRRNRINNEKPEEKAELINSVLYAPISFFDNYMGSVTTRSGDTLTMKRSSTTLILTVGSDVIYKNTDTEIKLSGEVKINKNGSIILPVADIAATFRYNTLYDERGLMVITGSSNTFNAETDAEIINRMIKFHTDYGEAGRPERYHEDSRTVVASLAAGANLASVQDPAIIKLADGSILAKMYCGNNSSGYSNASNVIFRSDDGGKSFKEIAGVAGPSRAGFAEVGGAVYLLGENYNENALVIVKSTDGGYNWSEPSYIGTLPSGSHAHGASFGNILTANGRIYKSVEISPWNYPATMKTYTVSASVTDDLMNPDSWTVSNILEVDPDTVKNAGITAMDPCWLESSMVQTPGGGVASVVRMNTRPSSDIAAVRTVSLDGKTMSFDPGTGYISFPGGHTGFKVQYDEKSEKYVALVNEELGENNWFSEGRNVLKIAVSNDLYNWQTVETVLVDNCLVNEEQSIYHHGFQYVDWVFDGDDIICLVREASDGSVSYHQANYLTFYRIDNFRKYVDRADEIFPQYRDELDDKTIMYSYRREYLENGILCKMPQGDIALIREDKVLIPLELLGSLSGFETMEEDEKGYIYADETIEIEVGNKKYKVGGEEKEFAVKPQMYNGKLYIPLQQSALLLGKWVHYFDGLIVMNEIHTTLGCKGAAKTAVLNFFSTK